MKILTKSLLSSRKIKNNYKIARQALNEVRSMGLNSPTYEVMKYYIPEKALRAIDTNNTVSVESCFKGAINKALSSIGTYNKDIKSIRTILSPTAGVNTFADFKDYINRMIGLCRSFKVGNCGEQAIIAANALKYKLNGKKVAVIGLEIKNPKVYRPVNDHVFAVIGLKGTAKLHDPKTWGKHAVIVDPWANVVMRAKDCMHKYSRIFNVTPGETIEVSDVVKAVIDERFTNKNSVISWNYYKTSKNIY